LPTFSPVIVWEIVLASFASPSSATKLPPLGLRLENDE